MKFSETERGKEIIDAAIEKFNDAFGYLEDERILAADIANKSYEQGVKDSKIVMDDLKNKIHEIIEKKTCHPTSEHLLRLEGMIDAEELKKKLAEIF
jgi:hypothetical protein